MTGFRKVRPKPERLPPGGGKDIAADSEHEPIPESVRRRVWLIVAVAFVARVALMTFGHTYRFSPRDDHFGFGWETGRIARAIALGHGFSNPFHGTTGPTAWIAPLYPYFLAGVFKIFGIYSNASAWAALAVNSIFSALTCATIYYIGREVFGPRSRVPLWSAWMWALLPSQMFWAIRFPWETSLSAYLLKCGRSADASSRAQRSPAALARIRRLVGGHRAQQPSFTVVAALLRIVVVITASRGARRRMQPRVRRWVTVRRH